MQEVIAYGVKTGQFTVHSADIPKQAKVAAHAINGFLLEYYPHIPKDSERNAVIDDIHHFIIRSLACKEVLM
jgi:hypothetical protein